MQKRSVHQLVHRGLPTRGSLCHRLLVQRRGVATVRAFRGHFTPEHHHGVELPGIYWHFVDVMWIVVYATIYLI